MNELMMMEVALFQLRSALGDDPSVFPIRISAEMLAAAVANARTNGVNAARVNDIEFALHDLIEAVDDAGAPDAVCAAVALLQNDAASLRAQTMLPQQLINAMRALQAKLRARAKAMERAQYRAEGTEPEELPHPPEELRGDALPIAEALSAGGFETPALHSLLASAGGVRYHTLNDVIDELDVVLGG